MIQDLRFALRVLLQSKAWTLMVVLTLALGIGANAAIFAGINGLLLRKLPVENPDALVRLRWTGKNDAVTSSSDYGYVEKENGNDVRATFSYPMYQEFRKSNQTMTDLLAAAPIGSVNLVSDGNAEIASAFLTSGSYYEVLGVKAVLGRTLSADDDRPDAPPAAVISAGFWKRRFGSDPNVVGKVVRANSVSVTIVGVLDPEFTGTQSVLSQVADISFPLEMDPLLTAQPTGGLQTAATATAAAAAAAASAIVAPRRLSQTTNWWLQVVGRMKPGVTTEQVLANLDGVFRSTARANLDSYLGSLTPEQRASSGNRDRTQVPQLRVSSASRGVYDTDSAAVRGAMILSIVVVLVLLIVCANVANLLLSRAAARQKEISVRLSMGATRLRLVRQLLTESIVLALMGSVVGIIIAYWGRSSLPGPAAGVPLDWRVFLFVILLALATGVLFGLAPAFRATAGSINDALKEQSRSVVGSRSALSKTLLVVQVALSVVLLIGAGLFLRTLRNLHNVDVGFEPQNLILFRVNPQLNRYEQPRITALYQQLLEQVTAVPGVRSATLSNVSLLSGSINTTNFVVYGRVFSPGPQNNVHRLAVAANFFDVMGMPLLAGRQFAASDVQDAARVAIINEAASRKFFPTENPIGQRFGGNPETSNQTEIIGVVKDVKYNSVRDAAPPTMYVPYFQGRTGGATFEVRTALEPSNVTGAVREAVHQVDPNLPLLDVSTQVEQINRRFDQERLFAQAYALFGSLALAVASVGLYGLMSYNVTRRTNEIGIRMALGARRADVIGLIMRESLILVCIGLAAGLTAAWAVGRLVTTLLFGVSPTDAATFLACVLLMILVSAFAAYIPARRASLVDPMVALHHE